MERKDDLWPEATAAYRKHLISRWELGDALIKECGAPDGTNTGCMKRLEEAHAYWQSIGLDEYDIESLRKIRDIAFKFPPHTRRQNIAWSHHADARSPEMLDAITEAVGGERNVNRRNVRTTVRKHQEQMREEHNAAFRQQHPEADAPDQETEEEQERYIRPPRREDIQAYLSSHDIDRTAHRAKEEAEKAMKILEKRLEILTEAQAEYFIELATEVMNEWHEVITKAKTCRNIRRGKRAAEQHLTVVA